MPYLCLTLASSLLFSGSAFAARAERARLTIADSKVSVAGQPAGAGAAVAPGETIVTGKSSRAELTLPDGAVVRIGQGSSFTFTGSKLVLNQGTALFRFTRKNATVVAGSRSYIGGPAVITAQAAKGYDGVFVLQGGGKVNGTPVIAGEASVLQGGNDRKFTFDLKKLVGTSSLLTKFPQTNWSTQTVALGALQHQLLAANVVQLARAGNGGRQAVAGNIGTGNSANVPGGIGSGAGGTLSLGAGGSVNLNTGATTGVTNVLGGGTIVPNPGGLVVGGSTGGVIHTGGGTTTGTGTLNLGGNPTGLTIQPGSTLSIGGVPVQAGQNVTINGTTYIGTLVPGGGQAIQLQPAQQP